MNRKLLFSMLGLLAITGANHAVTAAPPQDDCTGRPSGTKLFVNVQGLRSSKGLVAVTLYADDSKKFLAKKGSLYVGRVSAHAPNTSVCIHVPTPGTYAVAVYHDEDASRKFNRNGLGMPTEGFGFSNNPATFFGLPAFSKVRLNVVANNAQTIVKMKYP